MNASSPPSRISHTNFSIGFLSSITVVIFCWRICLMSESMGHHDSEITMAGASIETTLELWASSLREVKCMSSEHFGHSVGNLREYLAHLV